MMSFACSYHQNTRIGFLWDQLGGSSRQLVLVPSSRARAWISDGFGPE